jgi:outer membrane protein OmpA-like peptidoglycan-associated protein
MIVGAALAGLALWFAWDPVLNGWREKRIRNAYNVAMESQPALAQYPLKLDVDHAAGLVVLRGLAPDENAPQSVAEAISSASKPYRVERAVTIVAPLARMQELQANLDAARGALERLTTEQESPRAKLRRFVDSFAVFFTSSDTLVDPAAAAAGLDELAALLKASGEGIRVVGYADEVGGAGQNRSISRKRAEKVIAMLVERGALRNRLALVSRASLNPIGDARSEMNHSRRVSFELPYAGEFAR